MSRDISKIDKFGYTNNKRWMNNRICDSRLLCSFNWFIDWLMIEISLRWLFSGSHNLETHDFRPNFFFCFCSHQLVNYLHAVANFFENYRITSDNFKLTFQLSTSDWSWNLRLTEHKLLDDKWSNKNIPLAKLVSYVES